MKTEKAKLKNLGEALRQYRSPNLPASLWQLLSSLFLYFSLQALMWLAFGVSYWLTLALALPAAFFLVRIFIIQHDCGHGSLFKSQYANDVVGRFLGVLTLTPYHCWRKFHAIHHSHVGNLDRRGAGDVHTLTVNEYQRLSPVKRLGYRLFRNPVVLLGILPTLAFVVWQRFAVGVPKSWKKERASIYWTNAGILAYVVGMSWLMGPLTFLLIITPIVMIGSPIGVWLFYVQHQFEDTYWESRDNWELQKAGLQGSSYYRLPKTLQWLTASIGLHHIHHLDSHIPNYRLQKCLDDHPELHHAHQLTLWESLHCLSFKLWDEQQRKMVGWPKQTETAKAE